MATSILETAIRGGIRTAASLSPALGARAALPVLFLAAPPMPLGVSSPLAAATERNADTGSLIVRGRPITTYAWGSGDRSVLLLHGWRGRATQFAPLIAQLTAAGMRVVSFDAPAHGTSPGRTTDLRDWVAAAGQLHERDGSFDAIVGHSLGGLAALTAARELAPTPAVAVVSAPTNPGRILTEFADELALPETARPHLTRRFAARVDETQATLLDRYDAAAHPLSESTRLLIVHDKQDRRIPDSEALRLREAHGERAQLLRTSGLGHSRILAAEPVVTALAEFVTAAAQDHATPDDPSGS